jgi:rubredoxin
MNIKKCSITRYACCPRCKQELSEGVDPEYVFHWWRCEACGFVWRTDLDAEADERPPKRREEGRLVDV